MNTPAKLIFILFSAIAMFALIGESDENKTGIDRRCNKVCPCKKRVRSKRPSLLTGEELQCENTGPHSPYRKPAIKGRS